MKKIKTLALFISASLMVASVAACSDKKTEETTAAETTVEETETETEATTESTTSSSEETTTAETTVEEIVETTVVAVVDGTARYKGYMDLAKQLNDEGEHLFIFEEDYDHNPVTYDLWTYSKETGEYTRYYCDEEGNVSVMDSGVSNIENMYEFDVPLGYEDFSKFPCMIQNRNLDGVTFVDSVDDGRYMGAIYAVSADGSKILVRCGLPTVITQEELLALKPGDMIDGSIMVESVNEDKTDASRITLEGSYYTLQHGGKYTENETDYYIADSNDMPVYKSFTCVALTVSPDCVISDTYGRLVEDQDAMNKFIEEQTSANPLTKTAYWYYINASEFTYEPSNGWTPVNRSYSFPIVVKGGVVVELNLEDWE